MNTASLLMLIIQALAVNVALAVEAATDTERAAESKRSHYTLYIDADMSNNRVAGESIRLGVASALRHLDQQLGGVNTQLIVLDHRGSSPRSKNHIAQAAADDNIIAVIGGMHSPPLLTHRDLINRLQLLTLVPWAAATGITRPDSNENWIFRLSLDDRYAGKKLVHHSVAVEGFKRPYLVLERTGWGQANSRTMRSALEANETGFIGESFFSWGLRRNEALLLIDQALQAKADVMLLVANAPEGLAIMQAMLQLPVERRIPIRSHWGITGSHRVAQLGSQTTTELDLAFLQTRSRLTTAPDHPIVQAALKHYNALTSGSRPAASEIPAPTGFAHAFDLVLLLDAALRQADTNGDAMQDRIAAKQALENLSRPVEGLVKTHDRPFRPYSPHGDQHEALGITEQVIAQFTESGAISYTTQQEDTRQ